MTQPPYTGQSVGVAGEGSKETHTPSVWFLAVGLVAILAGLIGIGTIGYWYGSDMGWGGSGSTIVASRAPIVAAVLVPATAILVGLVTLLVRHDVRLPSSGGVALVAACLWAAGVVVLAVNAYPQVEQAEVISRTSDFWRTKLPVTELFGVRAETEDTITLEGRVDRRGCASEMRYVTLDRSTGEILETDTLPTFYASQSEVPPAPTPVDPVRFEVQQGSAPFICRS